MMGWTCFVTSQTSTHYGNVKNTAKMTTLHDGTRVQINAKPPKAEKNINEQYSNTFRHVNHGITTNNQYYLVQYTKTA